jgi:hypothetical protein
MWPRAAGVCELDRVGAATAVDGVAAVTVTVEAGAAGVVRPAEQPASRTTASKQLLTRCQLGAARALNVHELALIGILQYATRVREYGGSGPQIGCSGV